MELDKVLQERRSIRFFDKKPIDREIIKTIISAGQYAPRACNRQHWEAIIVDDNELKERLVKEGGAQRTTILAPMMVIILVDMRYNVANYDNIQSASAAVENMLLKAVDMGVGGCWVVGFGSKEDVRKILNVPDYFEPLCYILFGIKDEKMKIPFIPPQKKLDEVIHLNKYESKSVYLPNSVRPKDWNLKQIGEHQKYVSRARHLGIDYEFYSEEEVKKIKDILNENLKKDEKIYFLFGYDGTMLKHISNFLENEIVDCELNLDVVNFVSYKAKKPKYVIFQENDLKENEFDCAILPFSLEKTGDFRILLEEATKKLKQNGKLVVLLKNKFSFYGVMYFSILKLLGSKKLESFYFRSGPFEPLSIFKLKKELKKSFDIELKKSLFFLPSELEIYLDRLDGYLKRHGKKLTFLRYLMKPVLKFSISLFRLTKWIKIAHLSASVCIIARKK